LSGKAPVFYFKKKLERKKELSDALGYRESMQFGGYK
jgi:hypothetical protein